MPDRGGFVFLDLGYLFCHDCLQCFVLRLHLASKNGGRSTREIAMGGHGCCCYNNWIKVSKGGSCGLSKTLLQWWQWWDCLKNC